MALITISEVIDIVVMTIAIGYIFSRFFRREPQEDYDPLTYYKKNTLLEDIKYGAIIAAPAITANIQLNWTSNPFLSII